MNIANALAFLLYLSCSVVLIRYFVGHRQEKPASLSVNIIALLAVIFHGIDIFLTTHLAIVTDWHINLLAVLSWLLAFTALIIGLKSPTFHPGIVIYPLVALTLIFMPQKMPNSSNPGTEWHILTSLAAYSLLTLAALQAIILAIQERQLRRQHHFWILLQKLPPLQSMEITLFRLIFIGFILLTIGLSTGIVFVDNLFAQHLLQKSILSVIAWCVFAALLWGRWQYGWRGKTAIEWTLIGFLFLALAYLGSRLVIAFLT